MLISVIYPNGNHDLVKDFYLDYLISEGKIDSFKRSSGWVSVVSAEIRKRPPASYSGPERRNRQTSTQPGQAHEHLTIEFYPPESSIPE